MNQIYVPKRSLSEVYQVVWEVANGPVPDGYVIHHRNENHEDNRLENLQAMPKSEHTRIHHKGKPKKPESIAKMRSSKTGKPSPKRGKPGKPCSVETRQKISEALKGRECPWARKPRSDEYKAKMSSILREVAPWKGKHLPEEARRKMSEAKLGKPAWNKGTTVPLEKRHPGPWKGKKLSDETRRKMSEAQRRRYAKDSQQVQDSTPFPMV